MFNQTSERPTSSKERPEVTLKTHPLARTSHRARKLPANAERGPKLQTPGLECQNKELRHATTRHETRPARKTAHNTYAVGNGGWDNMASWLQRTQRPCTVATHFAAITTSDANG